MKKLLVLALAVVLTLSLAVVASAATFSPYVGGRVTWAYIDSDKTENNPVTYNNSGLKMLLEGKISDEETGTWATIGAKIDGWPADTDNRDVRNIYDFGVKKIGGSNVDIWYTNWENENAKRGQDRIRDIDGAKFHTDPMFDHAAGSTEKNSVRNALGIDYKTDNVIVNLVYEPNKALATDDNLMIAAATFNFDGGDVHVGYFNGIPGDTESIVGGVFKLGFGTIKADYLTYSPVVGDSTSQIQAAIFFDTLKFDVTVLSDDKYTFAKDGGIGFQVRYTGLADGKVTLAYRELSASDKADEGKNVTDFYIGYKYGIFETRLGSASIGTGSTADDKVYAAVYASLW